MANKDTQTAKVSDGDLSSATSICTSDLCKGCLSKRKSEVVLRPDDSKAGGSSAADDVKLASLPDKPAAGSLADKPAAPPGPTHRSNQSNHSCSWIQDDSSLLKLSGDLLDGANAPIFGVDSDGRINVWNKCAMRIVGYTPDEVMGRNLVKEFIAKDYQASVGMVIDRALRAGETANYEFSLMTKEGVRIEILLNVMPCVTMLDMCMMRSALCVGQAMRCVGCGERWCGVCEGCHVGARAGSD